MAGPEKELILQRVPWSATAADHLRDLPGMAPHVSVDHYAAMVETGHAFLMGGFVGGKHLASAVIGFEEGDMGTECVVYAAAGRVPGVDLLATVLPAIEGIAMAAGGLSIRWHTIRKGLIARTLPAGYRAAEIVMRKEL